jgi:hypothetical protein
MGTPLASQIERPSRSSRLEAILVDVEEPVFQSNVDVRRDGVADAGNDLPGEVRSASGKIAVD